MNKTYIGDLPAAAIIGDRSILRPSSNLHPHLPKPTHFDPSTAKKTVER